MVGDYDALSSKAHLSIKRTPGRTYREIDLPVSNNIRNEFGNVRKEEKENPPPNLPMSNTPIKHHTRLKSS